MKIVYSDKKTGKTAQQEVQKDREGMLIGRKIGEIIDGSVAGLDGFKLQITGLSDTTGAPSRKGIEGTKKTWPLISSGPGIRSREKGFRTKRLVRGNTIAADTEQINTFITEFGAKPLEEIFKPKQKEQKEKKE